MTRQQQRWASAHDWFSHIEDNGAVCVVETLAHVSGEVTRAARIFTDYRALRIWAGY